MVCAAWLAGDLRPTFVNTIFLFTIPENGLRLQQTKQTTVLIDSPLTAGTTSRDADNARRVSAVFIF